MAKRKIIIGVSIVVIVLLLIIGIRVTDPFRTSPSDPTINLTESPGEIAHDAMLSTETRDFAVRESEGREEAPLGRQVSVSPWRVIEYDNTDQQARFWHVGERDSREWFTNSYYRWMHRDGETVRVDAGVRPGDRFYNEHRARAGDGVAVVYQNE
jgi:hypothetical protein